jgi:hypothetical protein
MILLVIAVTIIKALERGQPAQYVLRLAEDCTHQAHLGLALGNILLVDAEGIDPNTTGLVHESECNQRRSKATTDAQISFICRVDALD